MEKLKQVIEGLKAVFKAQVKELNGFLNLDNLPADAKAGFVRLRDEVNAQLAKLEPLDMVPAAEQMNWALQSFGDALVRLQTYGTSLMEQLNSVTKLASDRATALQGWEAKVTAGELLDKAKAKELVDTAMGTARDAARAELLPAIRGSRKAAIELAGLPVPADAVLDLPETDFAPRLDVAKGNLKTLGEKGIKPDKAKGIVGRAAWMNAQEFAGELKMLEEILPPGGPSRTGHETRPAGDPLLGATGGGAGAGAAAGAAAGNDERRVRLG